MVGEDTAGAAVDLESIHDTTRGEFIDGPEALGCTPLANAIVSDVDSSIADMPLLDPEGVKGRPASAQVDFDRPW